MATLTTQLRNKLERTVIEARDAAEAGAKEALEALAVHHHEPYGHMDPDARQLRRHLRARARQLGDKQDKSGRLDMRHIIHECAYEYWHRMLFARFLAENELLIDPHMGVAITLAECEELARDAGEDKWVYASRCAQDMLPQIFRPDDPLLQVPFAANHRIELERLLDGLTPDTFTATDAIGWVYQFWQSKKKDEVNASGNKIGADELPAVTQLFTEDYMVDFLLDNTLGAWHAGKVLAGMSAEALAKEDEAGLRRLVSLPGCPWAYLRFVQEEGVWKPAAGTYEGWPKTTEELKCLDPCCGSGHFLVAMLERLVPMRMTEEGLSKADAVRAVLRDNIHGLEIDPRCTQLAAFALALAAWKMAPATVKEPLPQLNIACCGLEIGGTKEEWCALAPGNNFIMNQVYDLFRNASTLGSLIDPASQVKTGVAGPDIESLKDAILQGLETFRKDQDFERQELGVTGGGVMDAFRILTKRFDLASTNVPYLVRDKQVETLRAFAGEHFKEGALDLATAFVQRCLRFSRDSGTTAVVTPQNWLFLKSYSSLRSLMLSSYEWNVVARLGPSAFSDMNWWAANTALLTFTARKPSPEHIICGLDVSASRRIEHKASLLMGTAIELERGSAVPDAASPPAVASYAPDEHFGSTGQALDGKVVPLDQQRQSENHRCVIVFDLSGIETELADIADVHYGFKPGQTARVTRGFWEVSSIDGDHWLLMESTPDYGPLYSGKSEVCLSPRAMRQQGITEFGESGTGAWGRKGVVVAKMGRLPASLYCGELFDDNTYTIVPQDEADIAALWAFVASGEFFLAVRERNQKVAVDTQAMVRIPFDAVRWRKAAHETWPEGLPAPHSNTPTQWVFHGFPPESTDALHVAACRLGGYRWPVEVDGSILLADSSRDLVARSASLLQFSDQDGIVCIPSVRGEDPAADRLLALLRKAFGNDWTDTKVRELIAATGSKAKNLDDWLRNDFFEQHCKLFQHRPFIWHIWDGRKRDGFHALVNYHNLAEGGGKGRQVLEKLTHSYLGEWISRQKDGVARGEGGAEDRLAAAIELQNRLLAILKGEPPFDIFVRWKPLHQQVIGWNPDISDGVRLNVRPFMASDLPGGKKGAGILRWKPNIKWKKDRGKEPHRPKDEYPWLWLWDESTQDFTGGPDFDGNRWNDLHYTNAAKETARERLTDGKGAL